MLHRSYGPRDCRVHGGGPSGRNRNRRAERRTPAGRWRRRSARGLGTGQAWAVSYILLPGESLHGGSFIIHANTSPEEPPWKLISANHLEPILARPQEERGRTFGARKRPGKPSR